MDNRINTLFYSRKCETCKRVYKILTDDNLIQYFRCICIDDYSRSQLPKTLSHVPTMITMTMDRPLIGDEIFKWIQSTRFIQQQKSAMQSAIVKRNMIRFAMLNNKGNLGFNGEEMSGYSDDYAYTNTDVAQPKSFMGYGDEKKYAIFTAPEAKQKLSKADVDQSIKNEENIRKQQDSFKDNFYQKQQALIVMNEMNNGTLN
jgi:hypothetical protein